MKKRNEKGMPVARRTFTAATACAIALLAATVGAGPSDGGHSADDVVAKVQARFAAGTDYRAAFVQTVSHKLFPGRLDRSYGTVMFAEGGRMRWEYVRPEEKLFVYDGKTLWIYEPEVPQVFRASADADRLRRALAFLSGEGALRDEYTAQKLDPARFRFAEGYVLKLTPKDKAAPFKHVELYVRAGDFGVARSVVVDHEGNRNRFDFSAAVTNTGLAPALFTFTPPAGLPVLEAAP